MDGRNTPIRSTHAGGGLRLAVGALVLAASSLAMAGTALAYTPAPEPWGGGWTPAVPSLADRVPGVIDGGLELPEWPIEPWAPEVGPFEPVAPAGSGDGRDEPVDGADLVDPVVPVDVGELPVDVGELADIDDCLVIDCVGTDGDEPGGDEPDGDEPGGDEPGTTTTTPEVPDGGDPTVTVVEVPRDAPGTTLVDGDGDVEVLGGTVTSDGEGSLAFTGSDRGLLVVGGVLLVVGSVLAGASVLARRVRRGG